MKTNETFRAELARLKQQHRLSHSELAYLADCDISYISRILNGSRTPSAAMIDRLGVALGMPESEILRWIILTAIPERFHEALLQRDRVVSLDAMMTKLEQVGIGGRAA